MIWLNFPLFAYSSIVLWLVATLLIFSSKKTNESIGKAIFVLGLLDLGAFIAILWVNLERPPLRTLGETRLWYSIFVQTVGFIIYLRWKYKWFLGLSFVFSALFLMIDILNPGSYNKALMPALQSVWFVPHVVVYILSYALLGCSSLVAIYGLWKLYKSELKPEIIQAGDNIVYIGFAFLTFGLLFGALWAKEAWGHYWTWDPKETWAFLTWVGYLMYIHIRFYHPKQIKGALWALSLAFVVLLICWFGINYLPSAKNSVHIYNRAQ